MKKSLLILALSIAFLSCSKDDDSAARTSCETKVWGMNSFCNPGCEYSITLINNGDENNLETITINESTYNYYTDKLDGGGHEREICYEGPK